MILRKTARPLFLCLLALIAVDTVAAPGAARRGFQKVVIRHRDNHSAADQLLVGLNGDVLQRYDNATVIDVPDAAIPALLKRAEMQSVEVEVVNHYDLVLLPAGITDARLGTRGSHPGRTLRPAYPPGRDGLYVVQFVGPIRPEWQTALKDLGATPFTYVQFNSLVVAANELTAGSIAALPYVQYIDLFQSFLKYAPVEKRSGVDRDYVIHLADVPGVEQDIRQIRAWADTSAEAPRPGIANEVRLDVHLDGSKIDAVLDLPLVVGVSAPINIQFSDQRVAASAASLVMPQSGQPRNIPGYTAWLAETCPYCTSLQSDGFWVGTADTGLAGGSATGAAHHPDLPASRIHWGSNFDDPAGADYSATSADRMGHGTAVAGTIAGNPASTAAADTGGFFYGTGIAPSAGVFVTVINASYNATTTAATSVGDAAANHVYVQNHSYNRYTYESLAGTCANFYDGTYETMSQEFDQAVVDDSVTLTVAAGNRDQQPSRPSGCGSSFDALLTLPPAMAKNVIAMGGAENVRPELWNCHNSASTSFNNVMENSKRSTLYSGQISNSLKWYIKPDLFAPASNVAILASTATTAPPNFCGGLNGATIPATGYVAGTGTSFAAPVAAGAAILASRRYAETVKGAGLPQPGAAKPSLIKAMLISGAESMYGQTWNRGYDNPLNTYLDPSPNSRGGFGRLSLADVISTYPARVYINETASLANATSEWRQTFKIHDPSLPVKVVLAWTDPPGMPPNDRGTPVINDLDLFIEMGSPCSYRFSGNDLAWVDDVRGEVSMPVLCTNSSADHSNNVEEAKFYPADEGATQFTVVVRATTTSSAQPFSLVVYNAGNLTDTLPPLTPASVSAVASLSGSTWSSAVTWAASAGATSYEIYASSNGSAFASVGTSSTTSFTHNSLVANRTYLYKIRAVNSAGKSGFTPFDAATTVAFTDGALVGTQIKAQHLTQLRTAIDAYRASAGLAPYATYTDPTVTPLVTNPKAVHIEDLRLALDAARDALGLPLLFYTNYYLVPHSTVVRRVDVTEIRSLVN